ncbi:MAG: histidine kinase [Cyanophyceae cyanobacterium]
MTSLEKDKIKEDIKAIKEEGKLRVERIREIVKSAVFHATLELKEGSQEIRSVVKDAIATVIEVLQERGQTVKEEVTASVEGAVEGISSTRRQAIAEAQEKVKQLQEQIESEEQEMTEQVDLVLTDVQDTAQDKSTDIKAAVESAASNIKNSEEVALLQKRYAQLKAQLAIVQANLAGRYGERFEDIQQYLNDAKVWYDKAKEDPEVFTEPAQQKRQEFENKLGEAGTAVARKERQVKQVLKELWTSMTELFSEKESPRHK